MDNTEITCISLCSGYEGIGLGLKRVIPNMRTILYSEIEKYACEVLVKRMEEGKIDTAPIWTDLKTLPCKQFSGKVDIITGGFPCQPFSCAGIRKGTEDPRHLWPYIEKTITECMPQYVFLENVEGIISTKTLLHRPKLNEYCQEAESRLGRSWGITFRNRLTELCGISVLRYVKWRLERLGYKVKSGLFSASEVGAPHQRKRVFILAKSRSGSSKTGAKRIGREEGANSDRRSEGAKLGNSKSSKEQRISEQVSNREGMQTGGPSGGERSHIQMQLREGKQDVCRHVSKNRMSGMSSNIVRNSDFYLWPSRPGEPQYEWEEPRVVANSKNLQWEAIERSTENGILRKNESKRRSQSKLGRTTSKSGSGVDSDRNRIDRLRLLGNGVVPATAEKAFITLYERFIKPIESEQLSF